MNELDRILSTEDPLVPSSGFTARVMEAVRDAAAAPQPLPFPWGRFITGLMAALVCLASAGVLVTGREASAIGEALAPISSAAPELGYALALVVACLAALRVQRTFVERDL